MVQPWASCQSQSISAHKILWASFSELSAMRAGSSSLSYLCCFPAKILQVGYVLVNRFWVVFIDTSPSLSLFIEIPLAAAEKLIIPVNADDFSRETIKAKLDLVYGWALRRQATENSERAKWHLARSAAAHQDMADSNIEVLFQTYQKQDECFVCPNGNQGKFGSLGFSGQYF